jgi:predicted phage-related endonuclease
VAWQLAVAGKSLAHVAVLIGGNDFRMYRIPRNLDLERAILDRCRSFWFTNVKQQVAPENVSLADARKRWRHEITGKVVQATPHVLELLADREEWKRDLKNAQATIERMDFALADFMGDAEAIVREDGSPLLTWKLQKRKGYTVEPSESRVMRTTKWLAQLTNKPQEIEQ